MRSIELAQCANEPVFPREPASESTLDFLGRVSVVELSESEVECLAAVEGSDGAYMQLLRWLRAIPSGKRNGFAQTVGCSA